LPHVQVPDAGLKEYRRLMESHVPMYAHLEIGIALGLGAAASGCNSSLMQLGQAAAADDAGERNHICSNAFTTQCYHNRGPVQQMPAVYNIYCFQAGASH
jgi:hypothetical protein